MSIEEQIPELQVADCALTGWKEFDTWAYLNHPTWRSVQQFAGHCGLDPEDHARLLASVLLRENLNIKEALRKEMNENSPRYIITGPRAYGIPDPGSNPS